ncbi:hypothetical protein K439DRAFT_1635580, partial [Ramaria rubella]
MCHQSSINPCQWLGSVQAVFPVQSPFNSINSGGPSEKRLGAIYIVLRPRSVHSSVTLIKVIPDMYGKCICLKYNIAHDVWDHNYYLPHR